jgi:NAD(P)-dependent dehydrogenase (short-subunit alcohol dehydrogenase family)
MSTIYSPSGKVALVTGAAHGIGFETARQLHAKGAAVALLDLDRDGVRRASEQIGERTLALDADVTDKSAMQLAVNEIVDRLGGLDIAVANAGIAPPVRPMTKIGGEAFERVVEVNLLGVWRTVHAVLPQITERRGHVVVVASVYAFVNGALASPYAASKAGVEQIGRALRVELKVHGASASTAYFGFIDTAMVRQAFEDPVAQRVEDFFPKFMTKRLQPADAGAAIVSGIERRAPRIVAPKWWRAVSTMRGVLNPVLDRAAERDEKILEAVREGEAAPPG